MRIIFVPQLISSKCSHFLCLFWTGVSSSFQFVKEIWTSNLLWPHTQCLAGHSQDTLPQKQGSFQSNVFFVAKSQWRWGKRWRLWVTRIYGWRRGKWLYDSIGKNVCRNFVYTLYYMCIYIYILNVYTYIYMSGTSMNLCQWWKILQAASLWNEFKHVQVQIFAHKTELFWWVVVSYKSMFIAIYSNI